MQKDKFNKLPTYKIVLLGACSVGKSCMTNQFVNNYFYMRDEETNDDLREYIKLVNLNKGDPLVPQYCVLKIVDLFGIDHKDLDSSDDKKHEILAKILRNENPQDTKTKGAKDKKQYDEGLDQKDSKNKNPIYKDKKIYGFMFIYDVTQYETLAKVLEFVDHIQDLEKKSASSSKALFSKKLLVGNKTDLRNREFDKITKTLKETISKKRIPVMECSAFENSHVDQCFEELARAIYTDVNFEAYEQEQLEAEKQQLNEEEDQEGQQRSSETVRKQSKKKGGFLGCGGDRKDPTLDEDEELDASSQKNDKEFDQNQVLGIDEGSNGKKCSIF